jgi:hypothetical protein
VRTRIRGDDKIGGAQGTLRPELVEWAEMQGHDAKSRDSEPSNQAQQDRRSGEPVSPPAQDG